MQCRSSHLWTVLRATHEDTAPSHHAPPNTPAPSQLLSTAYRIVYGHTSGKFAHIFSIASRTVNCSSVKPDVSMIRHGRATENFRKGLKDGVDCRILVSRTAGLLSERGTIVVIVVLHQEAALSGKLDCTEFDCTSYLCQPISSA